MSAPAGSATPLPPPPPAYRTALPGAYLQPLPALRRGQLVPGWRAVLIAAWGGVLISFAAIWKASWTLGFSTWWLGPQANPRFVVLLFLPFVLPVVVTVAASRNMRYASYLGVLAALATAAIGLGDIGRQNAFALVELAIAGGALLVSVATLAGMVAGPAPTTE